jgi:hypothetical protein
MKKDLNFKPISRKLVPKIRKIFLIKKNLRFAQNICKKSRFLKLFGNLNSHLVVVVDFKRQQQQQQQKQTKKSSVG